MVILPKVNWSRNFRDWSALLAQSSNFPYIVRITPTHLIFDLFHPYVTVATLPLKTISDFCSRWYITIELIMSCMKFQSKKGSSNVKYMLDELSLHEVKVYRTVLTSMWDKKLTLRRYHFSVRIFDVVEILLQIAQLYLYLDSKNLFALISNHYLAIPDFISCRSNINIKDTWN